MKNRYYSLNEYLKERFGEKVYKLSLDLGFTCPNRDGTKDSRGCAFCLCGSSHFAEGGSDIAEMIEKAKSRVRAKTDAEKFIAYFQSYTNTYAPIEKLELAFKAAAEREDVAALSIATRPDCLGKDVLALLEMISKIKPLFVELGLQTSNEKTASDFRRCYENSVYAEAVKNLKSLGINVVTHIIIGLAGETLEDYKNSVRFAVDCGTDGLKLQLLHILKGTDYETLYKSGAVKPLSMDEYFFVLGELLKIIPENIVIHRLTGDAPKKYLVAPLWSADKKTVLNSLSKYLSDNSVIQGSDASK